MTIVGLVGIVLALVLSAVLRRGTRGDDEVLSPQGLEALGRVNQAVVDRTDSLGS